VPSERLEKLRLSYDELEALRLVHLEGMTQREAGERLGVSGSTVSRIADRAYRVVTEALVLGKGLCLESGPVTVGRVDDTFDQTRHAPVGSQLAGAEPHEGEKVKVAVPYLAGRVSEDFGSAKAFLVAEAAGQHVERTSIFEVQGVQHSHAGMTGFLRGQDVEVVLAGEMGAPMQQVLRRAGFRLYCGVSGPAPQAVEDFLRGDIEQSEASCAPPQGDH
jgi:predicted DNA-binding protein (UPF0251 family)/predicted Fe-Mo cluster-binding NifX family protein